MSKRIDLNSHSIEINNLLFERVDLAFDAFDIDKTYKDERKHKYTLHQYGNQLFCKFRVKGTKYQKPGIYFFVFAGEIKYLGECINLNKRINSGYGNISPRNCYKGGQITNCKINSIINKYKTKNHEIMLYFHETNILDYERKLLESKLIEFLNLINDGYNNKR